MDSSVPPPSPPHEAFKDDEANEVLLDSDREIIRSVIPGNEVTNERVVASMQFMYDDDFINTPKFKSFWLWEKIKNLSEEEMQNFDKDNIKCSP